MDPLSAAGELIGSGQMDLVTPEDCQPSLRRAIEQEGVAL